MRVHLVLGRQRAGVDRREPGGEAVQGPALVRARRLGEIGQPGVVPVVAELGGQLRMTFGPVVEIVAGQGGEGEVRLAEQAGLHDHWHSIPISI
jgi:hypothetical protein